MTSIFSPWQLPHDRLHAAAAHADAGADRVHVALAGADGHLGALARLADGALDDDRAVVDLRHFHLEEPDQEPRVGARQDELRPLRVPVDVVEDRADALPLAVALGARLLVARDDRLGLAEVDDHVAALEALDRAAHQLADLREVLVVDVVALGLADLLVEHLLGRLRRDAAEADRLAVLPDLVAEREVGDFHGRLALAGRPEHAHVSLRPLLLDELLRFREQDLRRRLLRTRYRAPRRPCGAT